MMMRKHNEPHDKMNGVWFTYGIDESYVEGLISSEFNEVT